MEAREEVFKVKGGADVKETFYRSVHGPIESLDAKNGVAYARARGFAGLELESMAGWIDGSRAETFERVRGASRRNALSISWIYADARATSASPTAAATRSGIPTRTAACRLPAPASASGAASCRPRRCRTPLNPARGFLVNWNNQPAEGWISPGLFTGKAHGRSPIIEFFEKKGVITLEDVKDFGPARRLPRPQRALLPPAAARRGAPARAPSDAELQGAAEALAQVGRAEPGPRRRRHFRQPRPDDLQRVAAADARRTPSRRPAVGVAVRSSSKHGNSLLLRVLDGPRAALPLKGNYLGGRPPSRRWSRPCARRWRRCARPTDPTPDKWLTPVKRHGIEVAELPRRAAELRPERRCPS